MKITQRFLFAISVSVFIAIVTMFDLFVIVLHEDLPRRGATAAQVYVAGKFCSLE